MKNPDSREASSGFEQISFLPEPEFNPIWPTPNTLAATCLSLMLTGRTLIHPEFEEITRSWRLAAVVFKLKELGWPIESYEIPAPAIDAPNRYICRYYLNHSAIKQVSGGAQ